MEHPIVPATLSPQAARSVGPDAPAPAKMMAAAGMAPLPPKDLVVVLYILSYDADSALSQRARQTLVELPANILCDAISANEEPGVIDGLVRLLIERDEAVERVILNRAAVNETFVFMAEKLTKEKLLEMICANEQRLLAEPMIIEKLYFNKHSRMSSVERAIELAARNNVNVKGIPAFEEAKKAIEGELIFESDEEPTPDDLSFIGALKTADEAKVVSEEAVENAIAVMASEEGAVKDKEPVTEEARTHAGNLQASLRNMTISQKIRMAILGSASQRAVLVRDANKLVIMAVLKSPAINDAEVRRYSQLKSLPEEAVRYIANKREWTKHYAVKLNLVNNPRTPIEHSLRLMNYLRPNDLRALERSKDIPGVVKSAARELRKKRTK